ncbi:aminodeoxychorismate synthase component I [Akkermansia muciniphila]|jgi:para-aminobenzoate synthetase component 1|uniref:aminodeoxychorismate synthase component I n=1 Tax=Akkermansia muciniphila TaxID=239935 RepID=UPI000FE176B8|nr:aminodeoxychorismate synthase component I [Akkermansia muciniphila]QAA37339.1 aminodeoxychorismate synthase component I [Akkermansia muciniphila]
MYTREQTISRMNALGRAECPFFFVISHDMGHNLLFEPAETEGERMAAFSLPLGTMGSQDGGPPLPERLRFIPSPHPVSRYAASFAFVRNHLMRGDSYLLNLCVSTPVETNLTLRHLFRFARAPYRMLLGPDARISGVHGRGCVCFSPEPFVTVRGRSISTFPMKGTVPSATQEARRWLETDEKENRESATIVDLMRNDLSMVATGVRVKRYRYISPVETSKGTILQCSSEISGLLPENWRSRLGEILLKLLPAGSVTGAPKEATCRAIAEAEDMERGFYTGIFGFFNGRDLDSAVSIRFMEEDERGMVYKSGGGITVMSRMEEEYREAVAKVYVPFDF